MEPSTVIHLVDDDVSFCKAVTRLLHAHGYAVLAYHSAEEYLSHSVQTRGCLLLDVRMPGLSGLQTQEVLASRRQIMPIIFISGHGDIPMSVRAIKAGAEDFLTKPIPGKRLLAAIEAALERYDRQHARQDLLADLYNRFGRLTQREAEVFREVVAGKLNKVIAAQFGTAERTVKFHRQQMMKKMGAGSLAELVGMGRLLRGAGSRG